MNKFGKHIGILTHLVEKKYEDGNPYLIGWIESPEIQNRISFHQKSLLNRKEINDLHERAFVIFEPKINQTERGERQDATNCYINHEKIILKDFLQYDIQSILFILKNAKEDLRSQLLSKIEIIQSKSTKVEVTDYIKEIKKALPEIFLGKEIENDFQENPLNFEPKSFLETIFRTNSNEYNQNLFTVLVEGLKSIDSEDIFQQSKFLVKFNDANKSEKFENLSSLFYQKATDYYKFRLWFEGLTDYCSTEILKSNFDNANFAVKTEIIERCKGNKNGFLVLNNEMKISNEVEEVYFSDIRSKLLHELNNATKSISVAVAWFTNDDLFSMLCMKLEQKLEVELIIINDYINNWELGLPFQKFVDLGGKLYLSEYPNIMHHKFCLIDNETIFNGSYNWTYYAELRNDENVMLFKRKSNLISEFNGEFNRLKSRLGNPVTNVIPFDSSQITKFERFAFRQYFSTDLTLKAETTRKTNVTHASDLVKIAIIVDTENIKAQKFQEKIQPEVQLEQRTIQAQNIALENSNLNIQETQSEKITEKASNILEKQQPNLQENRIIEKTAEPQNNDKPNIVHNQQKPVQQINNPTTIGKEVAPLAINRVVNSNEQNNVKITVNNAVAQPIQVQKAKPIIIQNHAVPQNEVKRYSYENLQLVFALDYSNSMEKHGDGGHQLYSSGKIQKVIDMIFAISKGLTSEQNIDMFLFETKSIHLPQVTSKNYLNYIQTEIISKHQMLGTDIFVVVDDIHKTYMSTSKNVFVILITDGENNEEASNQKIKEYFQNNNNTSIFWQFVGLGADFGFLESLDNIANNVSFFNFSDVQSVSNENLVNRLLQKFPKWYNEAKLNGIIK